MRSATSMTFAPGCRWIFTSTAGVSFIQAACLTFSTSSMTSATSETCTGRAVTIGDDERLVVAARQQLIGRIDDGWPLRPVEAAFGLIDVGCGDGCPQILQRQSVGRERAWDSRECARPDVVRR